MKTKHYPTHTHILLLIATLMALLSPQRALSKSWVGALPSGVDAKVIKVTDGDTIQVLISDIEFTVGYLGIDAPALDACYGKEAFDFNGRLVAGQVLRLERDVTDFDSNGRLMRYAYLPDGQMLNSMLVQTGYARSQASANDTRYSAQFSQAEIQAQNNKSGLWGKCDVAPAPALVETTPQQSVPAVVAPVPVTATSKYPTALFWNQPNYGSGVCLSEQATAPYAIIGKTNDDQWWQVQTSTKRCWVPLSNVIVAGNRALVSVVVTIVDQPSAPKTGVRTGAICRDGWTSSATGRGACSHHGGVGHWTYN